MRTCNSCMRRVDEFVRGEQFGEIEHARVRRRHRFAKARQDVGTQRAHARMHRREDEEQRSTDKSVCATCGLPCGTDTLVCASLRELTQHVDLHFVRSIRPRWMLELGEELRGKVSAAARIERRGIVEIVQAAIAIGIGTGEIARERLDCRANVAAIVEVQLAIDEVVFELPERHDLDHRAGRRGQLALEQ